ncbi:energy transducer TonB [Noviherbaspirillum autotrophicum]|uniref:energy transducer TonB n=1 Tax=Noviherbaspirillum autotrophicum TaxID=709839 RepID=UPI000693D572|nr:energy transducer TonB [Noviherbaspirillum autotrophicum]
MKYLLLTSLRTERGDKARKSIGTRLLRLSIVIGMHLTLAAWAWHTQLDAPAEPAPLPMVVRAIALSAPPPQEPPRPIAPQAKPRIPSPKPLPPATARPAAPAQQTAMQTAASTAQQTPANVAAAPQPSAPVMEQASPSPVPMPVTAARFDAAYLQNPAPVYPRLARKSREEGKVLLLVQVSASGEADNVQLKQTCGFPRLDEAAMDAVRKWRFIPARRGAESVAASVVVPIVFRLEG